MLMVCLAYNFHDYTGLCFNQSSYYISPTPTPTPALYGIFSYTHPIKQLCLLNRKGGIWGDPMGSCKRPQAHQVGRPRLRGRELSVL